MRNGSRGSAGRQPMTDKRVLFARMIRQGVSISEACRQLGIDRKTGHWWKNGGVITRNGVTRVVEPIINQVQERPESGRYLSEDERILIADGVRAGRSASSIAAGLGRAVSTVARELQRNQVDGEYRPHAAHQLMRSRRPRPKPRRLERDLELRTLVQHYLDQRWSPSRSPTNSMSPTGVRSLSRPSIRRCTARHDASSVILAACCARDGRIGARGVEAISDALGSRCRSDRSRSDPTRHRTAALRATGREISSLDRSTVPRSARSSNEPAATRSSFTSTGPLVPTACAINSSRSSLRCPNRCGDR